jgi:hypothetical protein
MNNTNKILFSLLAVLVLAVVVKADVGPPMMNVDVTYNGFPVNGTFYSDILTCTNSSNVSVDDVPTLQLNESYDAAKGCYWAYDGSTRESLCSESRCQFYYFGLKDFKVVFYLPGIDALFISNEVNMSSFETQYSAQLHSDGSATIAAINTPPSPPMDIIGFFALAMLLTLAVELAVAFLYLQAVKVKKKGSILIAVVVANLISLFILWFGFVYFLDIIGFFLGEVFAVVFEGYFIYYLNRKAIGLKSAMFMSLAMNFVSLMVGAISVALLAA